MKELSTAETQVFVLTMIVFNCGPTLDVFNHNKKNNSNHNHILHVSYCQWNLTEPIDPMVELLLKARTIETKFFWFTSTRIGLYWLMCLMEGGTSR